MKEFPAGNFAIFVRKRKVMNCAKITAAYYVQFEAAVVRKENCSSLR